MTIFNMATLVYLLFTAAVIYTQNYACNHTKMSTFASVDSEFLPHPISYLWDRVMTGHL